MHGVELFFEARQVVGLQRAERRRDGQLVRLPDVTHLDPALHLHLVRLQVRSAQVGPTPLLERCKPPPQFRQIHRRGAAQERAHRVMLQVGREQAKGGKEAGRTRDNNAGDLELARNPRGMHGAAAAEGEQRELAWIAATLAGDGFDRADHARVGQLVDAVRRIVERQPERRGDLLGHHPLCGSGVDRHATVQE